MKTVGHFIKQGRALGQLFDEGNQGATVMKVEGAAGGGAEKARVELQDSHLSHVKWMPLRSC